MKQVKGITIIMLSIMISVIILAVMWNTKWKPMTEMTELGYLKLEPITLIDGQTSTECYVVVQVDTTDGTKELSILISEAYDEISRSANLENYQSNQKIGLFSYYGLSTCFLMVSKSAGPISNNFL